MARDREPNRPPALEGGEDALSIIGPGMRVVGDIETRGSVRVEGVVEGTIRAGKAVVVGEDGAVEGDVLTEDAVLAGSLEGTIRARSRLEVAPTCRVKGEVYAKTLKLEEGAVLNARVHMGEEAVREAEGRPEGPATGRRPPPAQGSPSKSQSQQLSHDGEGGKGAKAEEAASSSKN